LESNCVNTIRLCIADNIINNVIDENSAPALWKKLEKLYLEKSLTMKLNLKQDLYRLKMEDGVNLMEHLNVFKRLRDQLGRVDVKVEEEDLTLLLLTSLPDSFEHMVTTVLYGKDSLQIGEIESALLSYEKLRRKVEDNSGSALLTYDQNQRGRNAVKESSSCSRFKSKDCKKKVQCYNCKEWGDIKRNYPTWDKKDGQSLESYGGSRKY